MKRILVIGAGAWGTSIANLIAKNSNEVFLNANKSEIIDEISHESANSKFLPNIKLSPKIFAVRDFVTDVDFVFIVTPSIACVKVFQKIALTKFKKNTIFAICSKGLNAKTGELLSDSFAKITGNKNYVVLSGPNFAAEVANEVPTITTIASKNKKLAMTVINLLNNDHFRAFYFKDPRTAEICGVVKNVMAIGCGIVDGLDLGINAKSALVMKGISEIQVICKEIKASTDVVNAAGFGDIFLTCSSEKSRNNSLGVLLAQEKEQEIGKTYEGISSASALVALGKKLKVKLDLCEGINQILKRKSSAEQIRKIISKAILQ
ncbi:MAG: NAD(P)H-dependent glycerol-3-phosphate dehydrogenase [Proteobacteria bacterium]|nr:NAD(P)H-dependent glycerol-3-phosphate dehydrogenase [Pseudomonadota bacterium]